MFTDSYIGSFVHDMFNGEATQDRNGIPVLPCLYKESKSISAFRSGPGATRCSWPKLRIGAAGLAARMGVEQWMCSGSVYPP